MCKADESLNQNLMCVEGHVFADFLLAMRACVCGGVCVRVCAYTSCTWCGASSVQLVLRYI